MLLFDENLAERLVSELADLYPDCIHVRDRGLAGGSDRAIWRHGQDHALVIVTKDEDFQQLSDLYRGPAKSDFDPFGELGRGPWVAPETRADGSAYFLARLTE